QRLVGESAEDLVGGGDQARAGGHGEARDEGDDALVEAGRDGSRPRNEDRLGESEPHDVSPRLPGFSRYVRRRTIRLPPIEGSPAVALDFRSRRWNHRRRSAAFPTGSADEEVRAGA